MKTRLLLTLALGALSSYAQVDGTSLHQQVKDAYAKLNTYRDKGITTTSNSNITFKIPFQTFYSTPSKVRFQFIRSGPFPFLSFMKTHYAVWFDGTNSYFACDGKVEKTDSIYGAWGGASGISSGTSPHISSFLLQRALGSGVYKGQYWTIVGEGKVRGVDCIHVAVKQWKGGDVYLWVSKDDHFIRRIIDDDTTIEFISISTNIPIDETLFTEP